MATAARLYLSDDRQHVDGEGIRIGLDRGDAERAGLPEVRPVAEHGPLRFLRGKGGLGPGRDHPALLLGQGGIDVQHEGVGVPAELGDDEGHPLRHQAGDERHIPRQAIELGDHDGAPQLAGSGEGLGELRPAIEGVDPLAGLDLIEHLDDLEPLAVHELGDSLALIREAEAALALSVRRDADIGHEGSPGRGSGGGHDGLDCV